MDARHSRMRMRMMVEEVWRDFDGTVSLLTIVLSVHLDMFCFLVAPAD